MYFDPYMQKAMLLDDEDPNALLEATGAPVSNPPAPQGVGMGMAPIAPTGLPMAPQAMGYTPDPELQRKSALMGMFSNINRVGGGQGLADPFAAQMQQNQELAMQRMRALQAAQQDNPFYDYELAKSRGYFALNEGETDVEGFRRFTQEQFKDPEQSVYSEKVDGLVNSGIDKGLASQLVTGLVDVKAGPGGIQQIINKGTGEVVGTVTAEQAAAIEATVARGKEFGESIQGKVDGWISDLDEISLAEEQTQDLQEFSKSWFDRLSAKNADGTYALATGPLEGLMTNLGLSGMALGELSSDDIQNRLASLQIVNLAPVTQQELKAMGELFATPGKLNAQNLGSIKSFMNKLNRVQRELGRKKGKAISRLNANYDDLEDYDRQYLQDSYGNWRPLTDEGVDY